MKTSTAPSSTQRAPRSAFTLVELLVVIAIIGVLVALLLPAVQSAREAARRMQCTNNTKQLGLALLNYEQTVGSFPPASTWRDLTAIEATNTEKLNENWVIQALPYMEQQSLHDQFNLDLFITHPDNEIPRSTPISAMLCPSDPFNQTLYSGIGSQTGNHGSNWARSNYGANGGMGFQTTMFHCSTNSMGWGCGANPSPDVWGHPLARGVMGANVGASAAQITDGMSNTILVLEIRAGVTSSDGRGVWALSGAGPSSVWGHGYIGDANGPNAPAILADDIAGCSDVIDEVGGAAELAAMGMGCCCSSGPPPSRNNWQVASRSMHPGGVLSCFADGSVHFIGDFIQLGINPNVLGVWDRLNLSTDGEAVDNTAF